jgi:hypothetical protein
MSHGFSRNKHEQGFAFCAIPCLSVADKRSQVIHHDNGQAAEASWAFIRELPPKPGRK